MNKLLKIVSNKVDYGFLQHRIIPGYVLENGIVLLDEERDEQGRYIGGVGMDGMYLRTDSRYTRRCWIKPEQLQHFGRKEHERGFEK